METIKKDQWSRRPMKSSSEAEQESSRGGDTGAPVHGSKQSRECKSSRGPSGARAGKSVNAAYVKPVSANVTLSKRPAAVTKGKIGMKVTQLTDTSCAVPSVANQEGAVSLSDGLSGCQGNKGGRKGQQTNGELSTKTKQGKYANKSKIKDKLGPTQGKESKRDTIPVATVHAMDIEGDMLCVAGGTNKTISGSPARKERHASRTKIKTMKVWKKKNVSPSKSLREGERARPRLLPDDNPPVKSPELSPTHQEGDVPFKTSGAEDDVNESTTITDAETKKQTITMATTTMAKKKKKKDDNENYHRSATQREGNREQSSRFAEDEKPRGAAGKYLKHTKDHTPIKARVATEEATIKDAESEQKRRQETVVSSTGSPVKAVPPTNLLSLEPELLVHRVLAHVDQRSKDLTAYMDSKKGKCYFQQVGGRLRLPRAVSMARKRLLQPWIPTSLYG